MFIKILRFLGLLCSALVLGLTLTHVLQSKGSAGLTGAEWLTVQNTFYGGFATVGGIAEVLGLLVMGTLGIICLAKHQGTAAIVPLLAAVCFAGTLLAFAFGNAPVNAKTAVWTAASLPQNWPAYRASWESAHTISAGLSAVAFLALAISLVWSRHSEPSSTRTRNS